MNISQNIGYDYPYNRKFNPPMFPTLLNYYWGYPPGQPEEYWSSPMEDMGAVAYLRGGPLAPEIRGTVYFKDVPGGAEVCVIVNGLPPSQPAKDGKNPIGPHGFHIHQFGDCRISDPEDPFQAAGEHWNPDNQPHGNHAGDFPVIFSNNGYARMCFFTNRFKVADVIGKSVIIHQNPDDFRTQPNGAAGKRLTCGVIRPLIE